MASPTPWSPTNESLTATDGASPLEPSDGGVAPLRLISDSTTRALSGTRWTSGQNFRAAELGASLGSSLSVRAFTAETEKRALIGDTAANTLEPFSNDPKIGLNYQGTSPFSGNNLSGWSLDKRTGAPGLALGHSSSDERVDRQVIGFQSSGFSFEADLSDVGANFLAPTSASGKAALATQKEGLGYSLAARRGTDRQVLNAKWNPSDSFGFSMTSEELEGGGNSFSTEQYGFDSKNVSLSFSKLNVDQIKSKTLGKELVGTVNKRMGERAKLGAAGEVLLKAKNAASLSGLAQQDYALTSQFGSNLKLVAEGNELSVGDTNVRARDERLSFSRFQLSHRTREVSHTSTAKALTALGHKALSKQIGHATDEWTANWQATNQLSLSHYRKEDVLNKTGNALDGVTTNTTRSNMVWKPSNSLQLAATHSTVEAGISAGQGAQTTTDSKTYSVSKSWGASTALSVTRNMTDVSSPNKLVESDRTFVHFNTARADKFSLSADVDRRSHSEKGDSQATKAALGFKASQRMSLTANLNRNKADASGVNEKLSYGMTYDLGKGRSFTAGLATTKKGLANALNETETLSLALTPLKNTKLTLTDSERKQGGQTSGSKRIDLTTKLGNSSNLRFVTDRRSVAGTQVARTDTVLLQSGHGPYKFTIGHKNNKDLAGGKGDASFFRLDAEPIAGTKIGFGYAGRHDLKSPVPQRDWSISTKIGSVSLTGSNVTNKGKDKKGDAILGLSKAFTPTSVEKYALSTKLNGRWSMAAGYSINQNLQSYLTKREQSLSFFTSNDSATQIKLNLRRGTSEQGGEQQQYSVYELSHSWNLAADRQITVTARKIHGEGTKLFPGGKFEAQLAGQWAF